MEVELIGVGYEHEEKYSVKHSKGKHQTIKNTRKTSIHRKLSKKNLRRRQ